MGAREAHRLGYFLIQTGQEGSRHIDLEHFLVKTTPPHQPSSSKSMILIMMVSTPKVTFLSIAIQVPDPCSRIDDFFDPPSAATG